MKTKISAIISIALASAILTSCGKTPDTSVIDSSVNSAEKTSSLTTETTVSSTAENTPSVAESKVKSASGKVSAEKKKTKKKKKKKSSTIYDKPVVNKDVNRAVKTGKKEKFVCNNTYNLWYSGINKVYSSKEMNNCFKRLADVCNDANFNLSFAYKNIKTGAQISYNGYSRFMTCSTIKAPFVKSLLASGINLNEKITKNGCWPGDYGTVASQPDGTVFTAKQLIKYAITQSDNTAYLMLKQHFGYYNFNNMLYNLGAHYSIGDSWIFTSCTVDDMLKCFSDIYYYGKKSKKGKWLTQLMQHTDVTMQITRALGAKYKVSHKYGTDYAERVFNDCAIVYADSPFILCIFTQNQTPETEESSVVFRKLAVIFDDINSLLTK